MSEPIVLRDLLAPVMLRKLTPEEAATAKAVNWGLIAGARTTTKKDTK